MNLINANCGVNFGAKFHDDGNVKEKNIVKTSVASGAIVAGAYAGKNLINKTMFGKSYAWNTGINKTLKSIGGSIAKSLAKTSGRQKALGALAIVAGTALIATIAKGAYIAGQINQKNKI